MVTVDVDVDWQETIGDMGVKALRRLVRLALEYPASREMIDAAGIVDREFFLNTEISECRADKKYLEWLKAKEPL